MPRSVIRIVAISLISSLLTDAMMMSSVRAAPLSSLQVNRSDFNSIFTLSGISAPDVAAQWSESFTEGPRMAVIQDVKEARSGNALIQQLRSDDPEERRQEVVSALGDAISEATGESSDVVSGILRTFEYEILHQAYARRFLLKSPAYLAWFKGKWKKQSLDAIQRLSDGVYVALKRRGRPDLSSLTVPIDAELGAVLRDSRLIKQSRSDAVVELAYFPDYHVWAPARITGRNRRDVTFHTVLSGTTRRILSIGTRNVSRKDLQSLLQSEKTLIVLGLTTSAGVITVGSEKLDTVAKPKLRRTRRAQTMESRNQSRGIFVFRFRYDELHVVHVGADAVPTAIHFAGDAKSNPLVVASTKDKNGLHYHESHMFWTRDQIQRLYAEIGPFWLIPVISENYVNRARFRVGARTFSDGDQIVYSYELDQAYAGDEHPAAFLVGHSGVPVYFSVKGTPQVLPDRQEYLERLEIRWTDHQLVEVYDSSRHGIQNRVINRMLKIAHTLKAIVVTTDHALGLKGSRGLVQAANKNIYFPRVWLDGPESKNHELLAEVAFDPTISVTTATPFRLRIGYYNQSDPYRYAERRFVVIRDVPVIPEGNGYVVQESPPIPEDNQDRSNQKLLEKSG